MQTIKKKIPSIKDPKILFLTFFGVGLSPVAPGTAGTLASLPFLYILGQNFQISSIVTLVAVFIVTTVAIFIAEHVQKAEGIHDPGWIVIDEVVGMTVAWLFRNNNDLSDLLILFVLFRLFDIMKIWPASYFDKSVKHGAGTILDDVMSGLYAGFLYLILNRYINF